MNPTTGSRKLKADRETGWLIVLVFAMWIAGYVYAKVPTDALMWVLGAIVGKFGAFVAANVKVHQSKSEDGTK